MPSLVRENIAALIRARVADWEAASFICHGCLNSFRAEFVRTEMELCSSIELVRQTDVGTKASVDEGELLFL